LPKGYSRELPRLLNGPSAGLPRVYDIALETISHDAAAGKGGDDRTAHLGFYLIDKGLAQLEKTYFTSCQSRFFFPIKTL
jgi:hypothetical protein